MGKPLLAPEGGTRRRPEAPDLQELPLLLDRILSRATQEKTPISLVRCRTDTPPPSAHSEKPRAGRWTQQAIQGLFQDVGGDAWYYVLDRPQSCLAVVVDLPRETVERELRHLYETWRKMREELQGGRRTLPALTWGWATYPEEGVDRPTLLRAAEASWYLAWRGGGDAIGGSAPDETVTLPVDVPAWQRQRIEEIAEREGIDSGELIAEALDELVLRYPFAND